MNGTTTSLADTEVTSIQRTGFWVNVDEISFLSTSKIILILRKPLSPRFTAFGVPKEVYIGMNWMWILKLKR